MPAPWPICFAPTSKISDMAETNAGAGRRRSLFVTRCPSAACPFPPAATGPPSSECPIAEKSDSRSEQFSPRESGAWTKNSVPAFHERWHEFPDSEVRRIGMRALECGRKRDICFLCSPFVFPRERGLAVGSTSGHHALRDCLRIRCDESEAQKDTSDDHHSSILEQSLKQTSSGSGR